MDFILVKWLCLDNSANGHVMPINKIIHVFLIMTPKYTNQKGSLKN